PIIVSGNHGNRVAESTYSKGRVYAYVMPSS
ncbi:MAG: TIGR02594 family protein, partial [Bradyrhizobiaceae bacterium]